MILVWGSGGGRWVDWDLWNPYSIGANHQNGANLVYEPPAYYTHSPTRPICDSPRVTPLHPISSA